ncbi:hypothetical protein ABBQ32_003619 [Trebouxia sp. C0010 RCD-2024]
MAKLTLWLSIVCLSLIVSSARPGLQDESVRTTADSALRGRRLLQDCGLEFQARSNTERLPLDYRLATIQDVEGTSLYGVLNDGDTALLVDGWVSYSEIRTTPIQFTGTDPKPFLLRTKLGIHDCGIGSDADDTDNMDIVPVGADPNGMLQKRGAEGVPLEERGRTSDFAVATAAQVKTIKAMILEGIQFDAVDTAKQLTYIQRGGFRIDQQKNGGYMKDGIRYVQLAVQRGSDYFAGVEVPLGEFISSGGIRKALYKSLEEHKLQTMARPASSLYNGVYKWVITPIVGLGTAFLIMAQG